MFPKCHRLLFYARFYIWTVPILFFQQYFFIFKTVIWSRGFCFCIMWAHQSKFLLLKWWQIIGSWSGEKCNMQYWNQFLISVGYNRSKVVTVKKWSSCKTAHYMYTTMAQACDTISRANTVKSLMCYWQSDWNILIWCLYTIAVVLKWLKIRPWIWSQCWNTICFMNHWKKNLYHNVKFLSNVQFSFSAVCSSWQAQFRPVYSAQWHTTLTALNPQLEAESCNAW